MPIVNIPAKDQRIAVMAGETLLDALKHGGIYPDAPCGGNGKCGKCRVIANGEEVLACKTVIDRDMTVTLPSVGEMPILQDSTCTAPTMAPLQEGYLLAFDIGTTSVVCYLLDGKTGAELAKSSMHNPQIVFGADVVTRIQAALQGDMVQLTEAIRKGMTALVQEVCVETAISSQQIGVVSVVGNPAMQQIFLGILPENLAKPPFLPILTQAKTVACEDILPVCANAQLLIIPDISGYVGADTIGCLLAAKLYEQEEITLLVDIGTNGEMVLGNKKRIIACATAAGPALEGANIQLGMRAATGAINHVWLENGKIVYSVTGGGEPVGICGSGLIDAVAVGLQLGWINKRGRILTEDHIFRLTETIYLTQEDVRQVQLAKGAIHAGITLMAKRLGVAFTQIKKVQLAGAFGSFLNPENACCIGLLPEELLEKIEVVGNAAGCGAKMLACDPKLLSFAQSLRERIEFLELAGLPEFPKVFAESMYFGERS